MALTPNGLVTINGAPSGGEQPTQNAGATMIAGVIVPEAGFIGIGSGATQQVGELFGVNGASYFGDDISLNGDIILMDTNFLRVFNTATGANNEQMYWGFTSNIGTMAVARDGAGTYRDFRILVGGSERVRVDTAGNVGFGLTPTANMAGLSIEAGLLTLKERATPTADTNYGKIYTKTDNNLYFQDGAGVEHQVAFV